MNRRSFLGRGAAATTVFMSGSKAFAAASKLGGESGPIAETSAGKIRGVAENKIYTFKGIPYGASTAGAGRFLPPSKPQGWTGVKDTLELGLRAPQLPGNLVPQMGVMDRTEPMGEDCLVLNVWSQGLKDGRKRPVMMWIHGGGFANGSAGFTLYDGHNLAARHDVVLVSINHRLNIFGFLYLAELGNAQFAQASNVGMLDIVASLEWVRDNIANFGGDPGNVTIMGQSGGGSKVSTLMGMPSAKGLFHRAIAMSGSAVNGISASQATESANRVLHALNLRPDQLAQLQRVPVAKMLDQTRAGPQPGGGNNGGFGLNLGPVVDGKTLPAVPFGAVASELSADVPLMISSTETESTWNPGLQYDPIDDGELRGRVKQMLRAEDAAADRVIAVYKKNRPKASNLDVLLIMASDASNFRTGTDTEADRKAVQAARGKAPVYKAYFQWYSPVRGGFLRAMHTMDIPFALSNVDIARTLVGDGKERYALEDKMSGAFVAFARGGNPDHKGIPHWPAYTPTQRATLIWNNQVRVADDPFREEKDAVAAAKGSAPQRRGAA